MKSLPKSVSEKWFTQYRTAPFHKGFDLLKFILRIIFK
nr:MAG TPA: hypothetical protein [Caudoviricetes sp.]